MTQGDREPPQGAVRWIEAVRGTALATLEPLAGGAGNRRYWRARLADGSSAVLMHARPEDPSILPPALRAPSPEIPFVAVTRFLARQGLPVPELYGVQPDPRWVLLEDLGDRHLAELPASEAASRRAEAVALLARVHALREIDGEASLPFRRRFDEEWIGFELGLFLDMVPDPDLKASLGARFQELARSIAALERVLCLRDFQSQNLMIDPRGRLRILDYQDALLAPAELDLVALLLDSYVAIPPEEREARLAQYGELRGRGVDPTRFAMLAVQRKCKDFSRFRYLYDVKDDPRFAPFQDAARAAVLHALPLLPPELAQLGPVLRSAFEELGA